MEKELNIHTIAEDDCDVCSVTVSLPESIQDTLVMLEASVSVAFRTILPALDPDCRDQLIKDFVSNVQAGLESEVEESYNQDLEESINAFSGN